MKTAYDAGLFYGKACDFCIVRGATAVGMRNPNSATNALQTFQDAVHSKPDNVIVQLGEVDCGFVIWYRAKKYNESIDLQLKQSVEAYRSFALGLVKSGMNVVLTGAVLPTIRGGQSWGDVANLRREVDVPLLERTRLTLAYNEQIKSVAREIGAAYTDITAETINRETGTVDDYYRCEDPTDHHLDHEKTGRLWAAKINDALLSPAANPLTRRFQATVKRVRRRWSQSIAGSRSLPPSQ